MPAITPLGDSAITITFGDTIDENTNKQVLGAFNYLKEKNIAGVKDIIPAYASLTLVYDIITILENNVCISAYDFMRTEMESVLQNFHSGITEESKLVRIPVCYHVSLGTDLEEMSAQKNISIEEIIRLHSSATYRVYMIGFLPGFAYMGKVDERIAIKRKASPKNVVAGSVGIAELQTGIYPFDSPGGWNIVGQTPMPLFSKNFIEPCLLCPGNTVKFEPITLKEFYELK